MARWSAAGWSLRPPRTVRVADESAFFGLPEGQRGIFVGGGGTVRIQRVVGYTVMADMMLTGRLLSAPKASANTSCATSSEGRGARQGARARRVIAKNTPDTNWRITNLLPRINDLSHDDGLFVEYLNSNMQRPPETAERLREFVEGRAKPLVAPGNRS
jgi:enoyl-CoA hydratase/carnithine racemase